MEKETTSKTRRYLLHGFSDASEVAYMQRLYAWISMTSPVMSGNSDLAVTIPRLELCGAQLLAQSIHHVRQVLDIPLSHVFA